jgi:anti-sigma B factor antagonist
MQIERGQEKGITVVAIEGAVKLRESGVDFFRQMEDVFDKDGKGAVLLDLSQIDYLDSTGIGELVGYLHRLNAKGCRLALLNPRNRMKSLVQLSNLDKVFPIFDNRESAIDELARART